VKFDLLKFDSQTNGDKLRQSCLAIKAMYSRDVAVQLFVFPEGREQPSGGVR
jgi:hypothetical protein